MSPAAAAPSVPARLPPSAPSSLPLAEGREDAGTLDPNPREPSPAAGEAEVNPVDGVHNQLAERLPAQCTMIPAPPTAASGEGPLRLALHPDPALPGGKSVQCVPLSVFLARCPFQRSGRFEAFLDPCGCPRRWR